eukprot:TRINITY_DN59486_c0_g1_i1.p1 TRINITY_DN59486_c0_g1~~TRINITY_DN59486_c0_g1_i1.p1  ORF type:complete len:425 (+),score=46.26 TRINITY_DN59486_c0_g1_i1:135-1409(+)
MATLPVAAGGVELFEGGDEGRREDPPPVSRRHSSSSSGRGGIVVAEAAVWEPPLKYAVPALLEICDDMVRPLWDPLYPLCDEFFGLSRILSACAIWPQALHGAFETTAQEGLQTLESTLMVEDLQHLREATKRHWPIGVLVFLTAGAPAALPVGVSIAGVAGTTLTSKAILSFTASICVATGAAVFVRRPDYVESEGDRRVQEVYHRFGGLMLISAALHIASGTSTLQPFVEQFAQYPIEALLYIGNSIVAPLYIANIGYLAGKQLPAWLPSSAMLLLSANSLLLGLQFWGVPPFPCSKLLALTLNFACAQALTVELVRVKRMARQVHAENVTRTARLVDLTCGMQYMQVVLAGLISFDLLPLSKAQLLILVAGMDAGGKAALAHLATRMPDVIEYAVQHEMAAEIAPAEDPTARSASQPGRLL